MPSLLKQSVALRADFFKQQSTLLDTLATEGQHPQALFIGCADSRLVPEQLFGAKPGDLFMLRNIANIVPPYARRDNSTAAVLEYALNHLQVPHLIVCGHSDCGGVRGLDAQLNAVNEPELVNWIELARHAQQTVDASSHDLPTNARHLAIVEQNVVDQLHNVQTYPFVRAMLEANNLELHGWVYHLHEKQVTYYHPGEQQFKVLL